jgi:hypothetical protein
MTPCFSLCFGWRGSGKHTEGCPPRSPLVGWRHRPLEHGRVVEFIVEVPLADPGGSACRVPGVRP